MDYVKKVNNLSLTGNLCDNWRRFKQNYDIFEEAAGICFQSENKRIASFLNTIGEDALELFNTFNLSARDRKCYVKIQNAFEKHCTTKKRVVCERFKFFARRQKDKETLKSYLVELTKMAATCEFKDQEKSLIRDQFVSGITDKALQADLLIFEDDLNFDKIVELLELLSVAKQHFQQNHPDTDDIVTEELIPSQQTANVADQDSQQVRAATDDVVTEESKPDQPTTVNDSQSIGKAEKPKVGDFYGETACKRCNYKHKYRDCPAFGKKCLKCYQLHHFAICCQVKTDVFKNPCQKCNTKHPFRNCPAFGKKCGLCHEINHFAINCPKC